MKDRLETIDYKYKIALRVFIIFLIIIMVAPLTGADFNSFFIGQKGIGDCFENAMDMYKNGEGRILGRFVVNFFTNYKLFYALSLSFLITYFINIIASLMGYVKNKYYYLLPAIAILTVNCLTFSSNYIWIEGGVLFTVPSLLTIIYFHYIEKKEKTRNKTLKLILLSLIIPLLNEAIGFAFVLTNIIYFIYNYVKTKKVKFQNLITIIMSLIPLIFMLIKSEIFSDISLSNGITDTIKYIITRNLFTLLFMAIPINYILLKKLENKDHKRLIIVLFNIIPIFTFICNFHLFVSVNINLVINRYVGIFNVDNWYFIAYWFVFVMLFIYSVYNIIKELKVKKIMSFYIIMVSIYGLILNITNTFGDCESIMFILVFSLIAVVTIKEMDLNINFKVIKVVFYFLLSYYIVAFATIKYIDYTKVKYINEQLENNNEIIEVKANPIHLVVAYNPTTTKEKINFKKYYNIPEDKEIIIKYFGIFEDIEKEIKD